MATLTAAALAFTGVPIAQAATTQTAPGNAPAVVSAKPGDVLRLKLVSGVHNLSFPGDRNPSGAALPPASDMLQLPGQTADIAVPAAPGKYLFQCDPHAALGMTGTLEVTQ